MRHDLSHTTTPFTACGNDLVDGAQTLLDSDCPVYQNMYAVWFTSVSRRLGG